MSLRDGGPSTYVDSQRFRDGLQLLLRLCRSAAIMDIRRPDEMMRFWRLLARSGHFLRQPAPRSTGEARNNDRRAGAGAAGHRAGRFLDLWRHRTLGKPDRLRLHCRRRLGGVCTRGVPRRTEASRDLRRQRLRFVVDRRGRRHRRVAAQGHRGRQLPGPRVPGVGLFVATANGHFRQILRAK
jgi:hypothetical protein